MRLESRDISVLRTVTMSPNPSDEVSGRQSKPRSPILAVFLSGIFPGLGQWYNGEKTKAALFAIGGVLTGFGPWSPLSVNLDPTDLNGDLRKISLAFLPFSLLALWSVVDAYRSARRSTAPASGSSPS